jgi:putative hemolysin
VFAFNDVKVRDVMTPRGEIFSMPGSMCLADALPDILNQSFSRIPIYRANPDDIIGSVHLRDILETVASGKQDVLLESLVREAVFVPQNQPIDELFASLRQQKRHLAFVVNEYGMFQGVATLEDLIEELVGEIYDESDRAPEMLREVGEGAILAGGMAEMRQVAEFFGIDEPPGKPTDTVSLWVLDYVGRIPSAGETFVIDGLAVRVTRASNRFIQQVKIERKGPAAVSGEPVADTGAS